MQIQNKYKTFDTKRLIDSCISGDPLAWSEFIIRYSPLAERSMRKRLEHSRARFNKEDLADMKQGFFIKLWSSKTLINVKGAVDINYWICFISANFATDSQRRSRKNILRDAVPLIEEMVQEERHVRMRELLSSFYSDTRQRIDYGLLEEKIEKVISSLNPKEKIAAKLNIFHEVPYKETAKILKVSIGTISSIIDRVRKKLKIAIQEHRNPGTGNTKTW